MDRAAPPPAAQRLRPEAGPRVSALRAVDADWALALNAAFVEKLSPLTPARFEALRRAAFLAARAGDRAGFLLAFDEAAAYDSPNFLWFRERWPRFVYVDRIVIDPAARRGGHARALYAALFARAAASGRALVGCEVNSEPPNPGSDAFHVALGFRPAGEAALGDKRVRYLVREVAP
jgi:predicted GNAT superfamily acetyltransferase